jgi:hypothetical protein
VGESMRTMTISNKTTERKEFGEIINGIKIEERDIIEIPLTNEYKDLDLEFQRICARNGYNDIKIIRYRIKEWVDKMKALEESMY